MIMIPVCTTGLPTRGLTFEPFPILPHRCRYSKQSTFSPAIPIFRELRRKQKFYTFFKSERFREFVTLNSRTSQLKLNNQIKFCDKLVISSNELIDQLTRLQVNKIIFLLSIQMALEFMKTMTDKVDIDGRLQGRLKN